MNRLTRTVRETPSAVEISQVPDTFSPGELTSVLGRRKWQALAVFCGVMISVGVWTTLSPRIYESHMKILVKNERPGMVVSPGGADGPVYWSEVSESEINSEIELLNSDDLRREVVLKTGLDKAELEAGNATWQKLLRWRPNQSLDMAEPEGGAATGKGVAMERALLHLGHNLTVTPVRKANIIQIDYSSRDPHQAQLVLRQLADSYLDEHLRLHGTPGTYEFFAGQEQRYRKELEEAEAKLAGYLKGHSIVTLGQQKDVLLQKEADAEASLLQSEAAVGEYSDKLADTRRQFASAPPRVASQNRVLPNQSSVEHLVSMLAELQNKRTQLLAKFRPEDRMVLEADKEIADTQAALEKAKGLTANEQWTDINPVHQNLEIEMAKEQTELAGTKARRKSLVKQVDGYRTRLMALGGATTVHDDLMRQEKQAEDNYLLYAKKAEEARIEESLDRQKIGNVVIAEHPVEPRLPSKPNVVMNLIFGALLASFLSLAFVYGSEYLRHPGPGVELVGQPRLGSGFAGSLGARDELEMLTGLRVLATVYTGGRSGS